MSGLTTNLGSWQHEPWDKSYVTIMTSGVLQRGELKMVPASGWTTRGLQGRVDRVVPALRDRRCRAVVGV